MRRGRGDVNFDSDMCDLGKGSYKTMRGVTIWTDDLQREDRVHEKYIAAKACCTGTTTRLGKANASVQKALKATEESGWQGSYFGF
jgi:hypothetical protein